MPKFEFSKERFIIAVIASLLLVGAAGWWFTGYLADIAIQRIKDDVNGANLIISLNLGNELKRIESAAVAVAGSPLTLPLLEANTPENLEKANNILDRYHKSLTAAACYLIAKDGLTLTSSNRHEKDSFVGQNYTFRPYFQQAIKGGIGKYFALGTVSGKRGFFASAPVKNKQGDIVGVVTIKKEIEDIEENLKQYIWFLVDASGIVFMSSQPEARLKSLWPLDDGRKEQIRISKQYGKGPFDPVLEKEVRAGEEVAFGGNAYMFSLNDTAYQGVSIILLWPTKQLSAYRVFGISLTVLAWLLTVSFIGTIYIFNQSHLKMSGMLEDSRAQARALAESEGQLRSQKDELESQKEALIAQRREIEESRETLARTEEMSRLILGSIGEGILGLDSEETATFVNPGAQSMLGYKAEELVGRPMHQMIHHSYPDGASYPREKCPMYLSGQDGISRTIDDEVLWRRDGTFFQVEYTTTPVRKDGSVIGTVVSFRDITERKRIESELKKQMTELERFMKLTIDREKKMIELKKEINAQLAETGKEPRYRIVE